MGACDPAGAVVPQQRQAWTPACSSGHRRRSPRPSISKLKIDRVRAVPASTRGWCGSCGSKRDCSILEPAMQNMARAAWPRRVAVTSLPLALLHVSFRTSDNSRLVDCQKFCLFKYALCCSWCLLIRNRDAVQAVKLRACKCLFLCSLLTWLSPLHPHLPALSLRF